VSSFIVLRQLQLNVWLALMPPQTPEATALMVAGSPVGKVIVLFAQPWVRVPATGLTVIETNASFDDPQFNPERRGTDCE